MLMILNSIYNYRLRTSPWRKIDSSTASMKFKHGALHKTQAQCLPNWTHLVWLSRKTFDWNTRHESWRLCKLYNSPSCSSTRLLDSQLSMSNHIASVARACYFHLRRIRQVKLSLNEEYLRMMVQALVISRLDYWTLLCSNWPSWFNSATLSKSNFLHVCWISILVSL